MDTHAQGKDPRHPIGVVTRRTGIPPDLLRAWERRYQAVEPGRAPAGRRLYSDHDVERLRLLRRLVDGGRRISDVARLSIDELEALLSEDQLAPDEAPPVKTAPRSADGKEAMNQAISAVEELDRERLERIITNASIDMSMPNFRREFILPLMRTVGERWHDGSMRIMHEHLATAVIRSFIGSRLRGREIISPGAPVIVVTTPAGQLHEIGSLMAASAAAEIGWDVIYLGPNTPAEEIAAVVRQKQAKAVALSLVFPVNGAELDAELAKLREFIGSEVDLYVGGSAARASAKVIEAIGAIAVEDIGDFQRELEARSA